MMSDITGFISKLLIPIVSLLFVSIFVENTKDFLFKNNITSIIVWNTNITIIEQFHYQILDADKRICMSYGIIVRENLTLPSTNETINKYILKCVKVLDHGLFDSPPLEIYILHLIYNFDDNETEYKALSFKNIGRFNYYKDFYSVGSTRKYVYPLRC